MWPILLRPEESVALIAAVRAFYEAQVEVEVRATVGVLISQMERGFQLELEEQELLRAVLLEQARGMANDEAFERGFFRIYAVWPIEPPYWQGTLRLRT